MPGAGLEPARGLTPPDFKSGASAFSATPASNLLYQFYRAKSKCQRLMRAFEKSSIIAEVVLQLSPFKSKCDGHVKWARDSQMYVALYPEKWNWRCQQ